MIKKYTGEQIIAVLKEGEQALDNRALKSR